jgi:16S rRNA (guanine527-N7)-methyltransferase
MDLRETGAYADWGLGGDALAQLSLLGDLLLESRDNVSGIRDPSGVERHHYLDSLSLLSLPAIREAKRLVDIGSGGGLPALVLAIALPQAAVGAIESVRKKCSFIAAAAADLGLVNVEVHCGRAEDVGHGQMRASQDVAIARALASLPVVLEYGLPLVRLGGLVIAMKGPISNEERIRSSEAAAILGGGPPESARVQPFPEAENRWFHVVRKSRDTPKKYPRRPGLPAKRPLGERQGESNA